MRKIFESSGVFIEDTGRIYHLPEGEKIREYKGKSIKETYLMCKLKEAIKGKRVRIIVFEEEDEVSMNGNPSNRYVIRDLGQDLLLVLLDRYYTAVPYVQIDIGGGKVIDIYNDGMTKVVLRRKDNQKIKVVTESFGDYVFVNWR